MNHSDLIEALDGVTAVSRILNIKPPSVSAWKKTGIPDDKLIRLAPFAEQKGVATRFELFPKDWHLIWPELIDHPDSPPIPTKVVSSIADGFFPGTQGLGSFSAGVRHE